MTKIPHSKSSGAKAFAKLLFLSLTIDPCFAFADVESSLMGLKTTLLSSILPVLAVMALGFAAFQFFTENPNAKQHLTWAVVGCIMPTTAKNRSNWQSRLKSVLYKAVPIPFVFSPFKV